MAQHPLQRLSSPSRGFSAFVHVVGIVSFSLSYKYLIDFPSVINASYGWHFQYLTILGLSVAYATFTIGLLADITLNPTLFSIKNTLSLCSAPLEVLISILYWTISAIDKKLLIPPEVELSNWADVGFHAMPSILLVLDLLLLSPPWTINALPALSLSTTIAIGYWFWIERCFKFNGFYPYPMMDQMSVVQRIMLFGVAVLLMTGSTVMLKWLHGNVNGILEDDQVNSLGSKKGKKNL